MEVVNARQRPDLVAVFKRGQANRAILHVIPIIVVVCSYCAFTAISSYSSVIVIGSLLGLLLLLLLLWQLLLLLLSLAVLVEWETIDLLLCKPIHAVVAVFALCQVTVDVHDLALEVSDHELVQCAEDELMVVARLPPT